MVEARADLEPADLARGQAAKVALDGGGGHVGNLGVGQLLAVLEDVDEAVQAAAEHEGHLGLAQHAAHKVGCLAHFVGKPLRLCHDGRAHGRTRHHGRNMKDGEQQKSRLCEIKK